MDLITNNPYRLIGLPTGAPVDELNRLIKHQEKCIEDGNDPQDNFCFPVLGTLHRTSDKLLEAKQKLDSDEGKLEAALFWFYQGSPIDEDAFDALKSGNIQAAMNIWSKSMLTMAISDQNASAFFNLSTLLLHNIFDEEFSFKENLEILLDLKLKFLESQFADDFKTQVVGGTCEISRKDMQLMFLGQLYAEIETYFHGNDSYIFFELINKLDFLSKADFLDEVVQKCIKSIEDKLKDIKTKRKSFPGSANSFAEELFASVNYQYISLTRIFKIKSPEIAAISNKIANEIVQCAVCYFEYYHDSTIIDAGSKSMDLLKKASMYATENIVKERIQENTVNLQKWINDKPEREKQKKIKDDFKFITSELQILRKYIVFKDDALETQLPRHSLLDLAEGLLLNIQLPLLRIRSQLSPTDHLYLKISDSVVNIVQNVLITAINQAQDNEILSQDKSAAKRTLASTVEKALKISLSMKDFDMEEHFRETYNKNNHDFECLAQELGLLHGADDVHKNKEQPEPEKTRGIITSKDLSETHRKTRYNILKIVITTVLIIMAIIVLAAKVII